MNIFFIDRDPALAAQMHCDQHVRKMLIESAQLLSTAHRVLDGSKQIILSAPVSSDPKLINEPLKRLVKTRNVRLLEGEVATLKPLRQVHIDGRWVNIPEGKSIPEKYTESRSRPIVDPWMWRWKFELNIDNKRCCASTHESHPSAIWARANRSNYMWLFELYRELNNEFNHRWGKDHACWLNWHEFLKTPPTNISNAPFYDPPQAMPDEYKAADTVVAYQQFYNGDKSTFATWTNRRAPSWYIPKRPKYLIHR